MVSCKPRRETVSQRVNSCVSSVVEIFRKTKTENNTEIKGDIDKYSFRRIVVVKA